MRKIEERMIEAVKSGRSFSLGNTRVTAIKKNGDGTGSAGVYLHGNLIAVMTWEYRAGIITKYPHELARVDCTLAGWGTVTTRSRLNALSRGLGKGTRFSQSKHRQMFDDREISTNQWVTL